MYRRLVFKMLVLKTIRKGLPIYFSYYNNIYICLPQKKRTCSVFLSGDRRLDCTSPEDQRENKHINY